LLYFDDAEAALEADGSLRVRLPLDGGEELRITSWKDGLRCFVLEDGQWVETDEMDFAPAPTFREDRSAHARFFGAIPRDIADVVARFRYRHFALLSRAARDGRVRDLTLSTPVLAWILEDWVQRDPTGRIGGLDALLDCKRRTIMEALLGWSSGSAVKAMCRLDIVDGTRAELRAARVLLASPELVALVRHVNPVPIHVPQIWANLRRLQRFGVGDSVLSRACLRPTTEVLSWSTRVLRTVRDIHRMSAQLGREEAASLQISGARSDAALTRLHDQLADELNQHRRRRLL